jgi:hypothetical protein
VGAGLEQAADAHLAPPRWLLRRDGKGSAGAEKRDEPHLPRPLLVLPVASEGLRAVSGLPSLTFLDLNGCDKVTAAGVQALRNTTAAPSLRIDWYPPPEVEEYEEDEEDEEVCP